VETSTRRLGCDAALETSAVTAGKPQLDALTGARGLAAWFVVFYHIRDAFGPEVPSMIIHFLSKGYLAVDLFFVLSGFVMWLNYGAKFERDGLRAAPDFLWRRLARIYPLHLFILSAMMVFVALMMVTGRYDANHYPLSELPLHMLLIQNWGFTSALTWNDPSWSISTEFGAYLLLPFVAVSLLKWKRSIAANLILIIVTCAGLAIILEARGASNMGDGITENGLIRCLFQFLIGTLICSIWQQASTSQHRAVTTLAFIVVVGVSMSWAAEGITEIAAIPPLFAATVYLLAQSSFWRGNPLSSRFATHIGDISYSTYLVHFFLWIVFKLLFVSDPTTVSFPLMLGFAALTYAASEVLYRMIENPGRKWMQSRSPVAPKSRTGIEPEHQHS
jgi:peptidoglycan/LPS O-acetylase OafA/YrhL